MAAATSDSNKASEDLLQLAGNPFAEMLNGEHKFYIITVTALFLPIGTGMSLAFIEVSSKKVPVGTGSCNEGFNFSSMRRTGVWIYSMCEKFRNKDRNDAIFYKYVLVPVCTRYRYFFCTVNPTLKFFSFVFFRVR
jgi:hypothetical protein